MNDDDGTDRKEKVISATQWCVYSSNLGNNLFIYPLIFRWKDDFPKQIAKIYIVDIFGVIVIVIRLHSVINQFIKIQNCIARLEMANYSTFVVVSAKCT